MRRWTLVLLLAFVSLVVACGDDEESTTADTVATDTSEQDGTSSDATNTDTAGQDTATGDCRSNADCTVAGEVCLDRNPHNVCGIAPREGCAADTDCADGNLCAVILDSCSMDGFGSECRSACTSDADCGAGLRCGAGGSCEALPCDDPASAGCPAHQTCDPTRIVSGTPVYDRHDGCFDIACASDTDCDAPLVCVNGRCQEGPGTCGELIMVP